MKKRIKSLFVVVALVCAAVLALQACKPESIAVKVALSETSITLDVGEVKTLTATASNGVGITWTSLDSTIATIEGGVVTAVKSGTTTIKATAAGVDETCAVTVREASISFSRTTLTLTAGGTGTGALAGTYDIEAEKANTVHAIIWSSSDTTVATVIAHATKANTGAIVALKNGTTVIKAKAGDKEATLTLTVGRRTTAITLNNTIYQLIEGVEDSVQLATKSLVGADSSEIKWTSSHTQFATVSDSGYVQYVAPGATTITAEIAQTDAHDSASATCAITTIEKGIQLNKYTTTIVTGESETLTATPNFTVSGEMVWGVEDVSAGGGVSFNHY